MISRPLVRVLPIVFFLASCAGSRVAMRSLKSDVQKELTKQPGVFAVAFRDLSTNKGFGINEDSVFHAASTMKTPVMIELFKQASEGKFALSDSVLIINEFKSIVDGSSFSLDSSQDSETDLYKHIGEKRTISLLLHLMITVSSNFATNLVIGLVDAKNVTQTMRGIGAKKIQVLRGVEDAKAFQKGLNNSTTARDLMIIFRKMANGETVNSPASEAMIAVLLKQHFNEIIPEQLPPDVKVAHKTGSITGVQHDGGIVFLPDGRKYVLIILGKDIQDESSVVKNMAAVSKLIYDYQIKHFVSR